jgi:hypothetical protein
MIRRTILTTSTVALAMALGGALLATHSQAKTKGGCTDAQVCCRYLKDAATELDCMDAKACKDLNGKEVPNKAMCAE